MTQAKRQVVLLHGLGRSPRSMRLLEKSLSAVGYQTINIGYQGIVGTYQDIYASVEQKLLTSLDRSMPVDFVGHSFGGILIRALLQTQSQWRTGRSVFLGTPSKGSQMAKFMLTQRWLRRFLPKVTPLLVPYSAFIQNLPPLSTETGIIAGDRHFSMMNPVSWYFRKATNNAIGDGVVEVSETQCDAMRDFLVLPLHHSFMMWDSELIQQAIYFLQQGRFERQ